MVLRVSDPAKAAIKILLPEIEDKTIQFKTHPNVDKKLWSTDFAIGLKDATRPFPLNQPVGVLKWRMQTKDESCVPLLSTGLFLLLHFLLSFCTISTNLSFTVNCWPSPSGDGSCDVNIEYELTKEIELKDVVIAIPVPQRFACPFWGVNLPLDPQCQILFFSSGKAPVVSSVDGDYRFNKAQGVLEWQVSPLFFPSCFSFWFVFVFIAES